MAESREANTRSSISMPASDFKVSVRPIGDVTILDCSGKMHGEVLDLGGDAIFTQVANEVIAQGRTKLVVNLDGARVDKAGIGALMFVFSKAKNAGGGIRIINPSNKLLDRLQITGIIKCIGICETEVQAVESFNQP